MKKVKEAIILAGGFGTRLKHVVSHIPKPMAPINNTPFLTFILERLNRFGIEKVVLSTGYLHDKIADYYQERYQNIQILYSQETEPLYTGGAIALAMQKIDGNAAIVLNGDTLFDIDFEQFESFYLSKNTALTIALKRVDNCIRYGSVTIDDTQKIINFSEKGTQTDIGLINGGIYLMDKNLLTEIVMPQRFSFEKEFMEKYYRQYDFYAQIWDSYFIDIGIPEDYYRAQKELPSIININN